MRRRIIVSLALMAVLLAAGAGVMALLVKSRSAPEKTDTSRPPLLVETVEAAHETVTEMIIGFGTARADRHARISAQVSGEIVRLADNLKPGAAFKENDELIWIDDEDYQQVLTQARAALKAENQRLAQLAVEEENLGKLIEITDEQLALRQAEFDRVKALREREYAHSREYDQQRLQLATLRATLQRQQNDLDMVGPRREGLKASIERLDAQVDAADLNVKRCTVRAPFDGRIDELMAERGERVQIGMQLLTLLDPELLEVPIELPVSQRDRARIGADCTLSLESSNPTCWKGQVKRISPSANRATRTFALYVEVKSAGETFPLMPECFVRAEIEGPTLKDVLIVPRGAIRDDQVFIFKDDRAVARPVRIVRHLASREGSAMGGELDSRSVVTGLDAGDVVITSHLDSLYDGAPVRLQDSTAAETQAAPAGPEPPVDQQ